jgi:hypothetical protein
MIRLCLPLCLAAITWAQQPAPGANAATPTTDPAVKKGRVSGKLLNALTGEPIRKGSVRLQPANSPGAIGGGGPFIMNGGPGGMRASGTATDNNGAFVIENVEPGSYRLMGEKTGFLRTNFGGRSAMSIGSTINVTNGSEVSGLVLRLTPQGIISGRVLDEDGEPIEGVMVQVGMTRSMGGRRMMMPSGGNQTNDRGEFRINNISPGRYHVFFQAMRQNLPPGPNKEEYAYPRLYFPGVETMDQAERIEVAPGQEFSGVQISLKRMRVFRVKGQFTGEVKGGENRGQRLMVSLREQTASGNSMGFGPMGDMNRASSLRPDGTFEIANALPGAYMLMVSEFDRGGPKVIGRTMVNVANSDVEGVVVTPMPLAEIDGKVTVEGEASKVNLKSIRVQAVPMDSTPNYRQPPMVDDSGIFTLPELSPEKYRLTLTAPPGSYVKSITSSGQDIRDSGIDLALGSGKVDVVLSTKVASITGTVQKAKSEDPPGMAILVQLDAKGNPVLMTNSSPIAQVDSSGNFTFSNLGPGEYLAMAFEEVDFPSASDPDFLKKFVSRAATVKLSEGESKSVSTRQIPYAESSPLAQQ